MSNPRTEFLPWERPGPLNDLAMYLLSHKEDIRLGVNDFGDLRRVYESVFEESLYAQQTSTDGAN